MVTQHQERVRRTFASNLEEAMRAHGLSQSALGRMLDVEQSDVSGWLGRGELNGRGIVPRGLMLARICEALNVSADWLLFGRGRREGGLPSVPEAFWEGCRWTLQQVREDLASLEAEMRGRAGHDAAPSPSEVRVAADLAAKHAAAAAVAPKKRRGKSA